MTGAHRGARVLLEAGRPSRLVLAACLLVVSVGLLSGCASTSPDTFVNEPGVTVRVDLTSGDSISGTLVGMEDGALVVDRSIPKSTGLEVVRRDGLDIVYLHGAPIGSAVEVRAVDVLVRERLGFFEIAEVRVVNKAYFGWGTGVAAVLAFMLARLVEDL